MTPITERRLLLVDDNLANLQLLEQVLEEAGYHNLLLTRDPATVEDLCASWEPDLVLLDLHMPGSSGYQVMAAIREHMREPEHLPVLVITADTTREARRRALSLGARDFVNKPIDSAELLLRIGNLLRTRDLQHALADRADELGRGLHTTTAELDDARIENLSLLARVAEYHSDDTHEHTQRVGHTAAALAEALNLPIEMIAAIRDAAPLHDIGKVGVPDHILLKPGALTPEEREVMMRHVEIGARILEGVRSPVLRLARQIVQTHHERWDGRGYVAGLKGEEIPLVGRITALADVFDALTHSRCYKEAQSLENTIAYIAGDHGQQFDPHMATVFCTIADEHLISPPQSSAASPPTPPSFDLAERL